MVDAGPTGWTERSEGSLWQSDHVSKRKEAKWTLGDLNPRPSGCKPDALPAELSAPNPLRESIVFESSPQIRPCQWSHLYQDRHQRLLLVHR